MSYYKLFDLKDIGLNSPSIGSLMHKFQSLGNKALITRSDIEKNIKQKMLIDKVIDFLLENNIIQINDEENNEVFKIIVDFPQTSLEKESKEYLDNKLFISQKQLLVEKIKHYQKKGLESYVVFLDLANSTDDHNGDIFLKKDIMGKDFPKIINQTIDSFFHTTKGYLVSQKGDEAHLFFFTKEDANRFIDKFLSNYSKELFNKIESYNQTRTINNAFTDKMYLKVFIAHSEVDTPNYDINTMPNFNNMLAFIWLNRVEKAFKEALKGLGQNEIEKYFIASQEKFNDSHQIKVDEKEFGSTDIYYRLF